MGKGTMLMRQYLWVANGIGARRNMRLRWRRQANPRIARLFNAATSRRCAGFQPERQGRKQPRLRRFSQAACERFDAAAWMRMALVHRRARHSAIHGFSASPSTPNMVGGRDSQVSLPIYRVC